MNPAQKALALVLKVFDKAIYTIIFLCIAGFVTLAFLQVFCRFILNDSLTWSEELCRYLFVWMVFLGAGVGILHKRHIIIDIVPNLIPGSARKYYDVAINVLILAFTVLLMRYGLVFAQRGMRQNSPAMQIPLGYVYGGIILGGAVMFINTVRVTLAGFLEGVKPEPEPEPQLEMSQEEFNKLLGIETGKESDNA